MKYLNIRILHYKSEQEVDFTYLLKQVNPTTLERLSIDTGNTKEVERLIKNSPGLKEIDICINDKETLDAIKNSASKNFDLFIANTSADFQSQDIQDAFCSIKIKTLVLNSQWQFAKNVLSAIDKDSLQSLCHNTGKVYEDGADVVTTLSKFTNLKELALNTKQLNQNTVDQISKYLSNPECKIKDVNLFGKQSTELTLWQNQFDNAIKQRQNPQTVL